MGESLLTSAHSGRGCSDVLGTVAVLDGMAFKAPDIDLTRHGATFMQAAASASAGCWGQACKERTVKTACKELRGSKGTPHLAQ